MVSAVVESGEEVAEEGLAVFVEPLGGEDDVSQQETVQHVGEQDHGDYSATVGLQTGHCVRHHDEEGRVHTDEQHRHQVEHPVQYAAIVY